MQKIIAKIENFAKRFELVGEYNIHMEQEFQKLKDFSLQLKPCVNEVSKFCELLNTRPQQIKIINSDDICHKGRLYLEWSTLREVDKYTKEIIGIIGSTCYHHVDLNEVLKLLLDKSTSKSAKIDGY